MVSEVGLPCSSSCKPGEDESQSKKVALVALHVFRHSTEVASLQDMRREVAIEQEGIRQAKTDFQVPFPNRSHGLG